MYVTVDQPGRQEAPLPFDHLVNSHLITAGRKITDGADGFALEKDVYRVTDRFPRRHDAHIFD